LMLGIDGLFFICLCILICPMSIMLYSQHWDYRFFQYGHTVIISIIMTMCRGTSHRCQIVPNAWLFAWMPNIFRRGMKCGKKATWGKFVLQLTFFNFSSVNPWLN
jgi:hypothetical protein